MVEEQHLVWLIESGAELHLVKNTSYYRMHRREDAYAAYLRAPEINGMSAKLIFNETADAFAISIP